MDSRVETGITSTDNPRIKQLVHLREKRTRDATGLFLIEGFRELSRAFAGNVTIQELFICPELFLGENERGLIASLQKKGTKVIRTTEKVFHKISYRDRPDGLIAVAVQMRFTLTTIEKVLQGKNAPLLVIAEAVEKPGNLGTILRSADGAGADGVIIVDRCTDIYNPNVVRASVGTLFTVPVVESSSDAVIPWLRERRIAIAAATPSGSTVYYEADFTKPVAIAFGTEQLGLTRQWMAAATLQVVIPMHGVADSLNVAQASTILLYEAARQRSSHPL